ncbi:peroxiredoxin [Aliikangiella marina]|uniref:thioredoxin-dependent peroxiredoxin n=1 Tax=Aliikangiella marina TaxID=1712262 RepID=A0A545T6Q9_9GAMM|nr:peroxiredoxin [Aliikangiella marina]TQV72906.1 peroxiredoxin [Aliikangiella marina]
MKKILYLTIMFLSFNVLASSNQWEGVPLAEFELLDQNGETRTSEEFKGSWLVLYFYPKDKTPGCTVEAQNFTEDFAKYQALNANIVGVSYDNVDSHKAFADEYDMPFTLLADTEAKLSKAMKVDRILPFPHSSRQTFLVNPEGVIVHHFEKVSVHEHSADLLALLKEKQAAKKM